MKQQVNKQRKTIAEPNWRRATEKATKLALLAAASRAVEGPESVSVNVDDVQCATAIVHWCVNNLLVGAEKFMAATRYERDRKKMFAVGAATGCKQPRCRAARTLRRALRLVRAESPFACR